MIFARCFHLKINCKQYVAWWSCSLPKKYTTGELCQMGCSYELEADSHDKIFPEVKKRSISSIVCDQ